MTKNVDAIRQLFGALNSRVGNLPRMPGIFPDYSAPIVHNAPDGREMPVMLTTAEEVETWMNDALDEAKTLQRPLPDGALRIVAEG